MRIDLVRLWNIRNYGEAEFRPAEGTTLVAGENGAGKTTLLEGIGLFATLSSPRARQLSVLVRDGEPEGGVRMEVDGGAPLEVRVRGGRSLLRAGGSGVAAKTFLGRFRSVLFAPEDLDIVRGEPELRRRAVDELLVQLRPAYRGVRQDFERALRQRNAALRYGRERDAALYDSAVATTAAQVVEARREIVGELRTPAADVYRELAGHGELEIHYRDSAEANGRSGAELVAFLEERYRATLPGDLDRGRTGIGPHRDDLELTLDGRAARTHASRGEQRSIALAVRLAELRLLPGAVLLLDDVLSELDPERRRRVFEVIGERQTVVTTTDRETIPPGVKVESMWFVEGGRLNAVG